MKLVRIFRYLLFPVVVLLLPQPGGPVGLLHGSPGPESLIPSLLLSTIKTLLLGPEPLLPDSGGGAARLRLLQTRAAPLLPRRPTQGVPCEGNSREYWSDTERYCALIG